MNAAWEPVTPLADGKPIFRDVVLDQALCQGDLLAISSFVPGAAGRTLRLLRMPEGVPLGEFPQSERHGKFALSGDGRFLARQIGQSQVEVREVADLAQPRLVTTTGKFHPGCDVILGRGLLAAQVGKYRHLFDWRSEELVISLRDPFKDNDSKSLEMTGRDRWVRADTRQLPECVRYDPRRFLAAAVLDLCVVVDTFGQLVVFDRAEKLLCMFFVFRQRVAGWMPDGTRFGLPALSQGRETPGALKKFGRVLREASAWSPGKGDPA